MPSDRKVLELLREAGEKGLTTGQFLDLYIGRHGSAISELRRQGHIIDTVPLDPVHAPRGPATYYLREEVGLGAGPPEATPARSSVAPTSVEPNGLFDAAEFENRPGYADAEAA